MTDTGELLLNLLSPLLPAIADAAGENDRKGRFPAETFDALMAAGVLKATVPEEYGGLGVTNPHDVALALLHVAKADPSVALALHMQFSRGLTLAHDLREAPAATAQLMDGLLRLIGTKNAVITGAVAEAPGSTTVLQAEDGDGPLRLSGRKHFVTLAPAATHFVVSAQLHRAGRPPVAAAAVVPRDSHGLVVNDDWDGLGMRASGSVSVGFDGCRVPADAVQVRQAGDSDAALVGRTLSTVCMMGIYAGAAVAARDVAVAALRRRDLVAPSARSVVAEVEADLYALRSVGAAALTAIAAYLAEPAGAGQAMMGVFQRARVVTNRAAVAVVDACVSLVGGSAYNAAHPLARLYRDVRAGGLMQPYPGLAAIDYISEDVLTPT
ncbi:acyl-CoA/acyl-ACP dehydrogenase [Actinomadura sp. ATCC 31491]|uniref:Dibenzothiophene monooxygenase n=1 Tax=Actinomadura luzonensis TaxID=2805427 RepID=A0ABT0FJC0_9ACTN|nr:acyl-CoA dehydrogenase family protein [Actinomadura luzonensis]MCK2212405.1 acyl-CoA/acyl-ACP dehydrogenase [Actinomadura luzonensis]